MARKYEEASLLKNTVSCASHAYHAHLSPTYETITFLANPMYVVTTDRSITSIRAIYKRRNEDPVIVL